MLHGHLIVGTTKPFTKQQKNKLRTAFDDASVYPSTTLQLACELIVFHTRIINAFMKKILIILAIGILSSSSIRTFAQEKWIKFSYEYATAYFSRQPLIDQEIIKDGKLNPGIKDSLSLTLSAERIKHLNKILTRKDRNKLYAIGECFLPRHGVVFWDKDNSPIAWVSVCFECNQIKATPKLDKNDLKDLKTFFENIGFPVDEDRRATDE
jgi:hypothetical protein